MMCGEEVSYQVWQILIRIFITVTELLNTQKYWEDDITTAATTRAE